MTPPPTPIDDAPVHVDQRARVEILAAILLTMFLSALDQTVVGTALPRIVTELSGNELYTWVVTIYLLTATVSGPIYGKRPTSSAAADDDDRRQPLLVARPCAASRRRCGSSSCAEACRASVRSDLPTRWRSSATSSARASAASTRPVRRIFDRLDRRSALAAS